jgi:hypothetical protein
MTRALMIDFWLDQVLIGVVAAETSHLTRLVLHEWIGVTLTVAMSGPITSTAASLHNTARAGKGPTCRCAIADRLAPR